MNRLNYLKLVDGYIDDLITHKRSAHTIKNYQVTFHQLGYHISDTLQRYDLTQEEFEQMVYHYLKNLSMENAANTTLNAKRAPLRGLIRFAQKRGYIHTRFDGNIQSLRIDTGKEKPVLKAEEIERIDQLLRKDIEDARGYDIFLKARNRFLFMTFIWTGGRIGEIAQLRWKDIDTEGGKITLLGKGNKTRTIPIVDTYLLHIFRYKEVLNKLQTEQILSAAFESYIFQSQHSTKKNGGMQKHMTTRAVYNILNDIFQRAGIQAGITPHSLRHTLASYAIKEGVSVTVLSKILGHSSVRITTEVYAHVIDERQVKEEMRKISYT